MSQPPRKIADVLNGNETHFLDYIIVLAKHSRLIIFSSLAVTLLVYLTLFILPDKYTATARLLPPRMNLTVSAQLLNSLSTASGAEATGLGGGVSGMAGVATSLLGLKSTGDLYVGIMTGDTIADRIIERFNLKKLYKEKYIEEARKALWKNAKVELGRKDGIITIEMTDKDRNRASEMANAFVEELNSLVQALAVQEAKSRLSFLEKERVESNKNLAAAENALREFSDKNSVIQIDTQTRDMLLYIAQLRARIDAKEVQIQVTRQQATQFNYDVVRLETEVNGLKNKLQAAEKQYDIACAGDTCLSTSKVPTLGLEYVRLYREVKFQNGLNQFYAKMVELARLDTVKDFPVAQMVDRAVPPEKRSNKRFLPALLSGIATFFVMIFFSFGYEAWQKTQQQEEETQRLALLKSYLQPFLKLPESIAARFKRTPSN